MVQAALVLVLCYCLLPTGRTWWLWDDDAAATAVPDAVVTTTHTEPLLVEIPAAAAAAPPNQTERPSDGATTSATAADSAATSVSVDTEEEVRRIEDKMSEVIAAHEGLPLDETMHEDEFGQHNPEFDHQVYGCTGLGTL